MTRRLHLLTLLFISLSAISSAAVIPVAKRAAQGPAIAEPIPTSVSSSSISPIAAPTTTPTPSEASATPTPTPDIQSDSGDSSSYHYLDQDAAYYENEGASGESGAFIKVSMGAQIGIIIAIVLVGISGLVGVIWFYIKKRREWEAAAVRRRTRNARSLIIAAKIQREKDEEEERLKKLKEQSNNKRDSGSTTASSTDVKVVDDVESRGEKSSFDNESITSPKPWWKKLAGN